jgi:deaminated glutathione amidase
MGCYGHVLRAAAIQMSSRSDKRANVERAEALIRAAANRGAGLVVLPEVFPWRGPRGAEAEFAEAIPGPTSERMAGLARELGIHLQAGSISERIEGDRRCYNTALLFAPDGKIVGRYRKIHLFDVEIHGQVSAHQSQARKLSSAAF